MLPHPSSRGKYFAKLINVTIGVKGNLCNKLRGEKDIYKLDCKIYSNNQNYIRPMKQFVTLKWPTPDGLGNPVSHSTGEGMHY